MQDKVINSSKSIKNGTRFCQRLVNKTNKHFKSVDLENQYNKLTFTNI